MSQSPLSTNDQSLSDSHTRPPSCREKGPWRRKLNSGYTVVLLCAETGRPFVLHEDQSREEGYKIVKAHEYSLTNPSARFKIKRKGKYTSFKSVANKGLSIGCSDRSPSLDVLASQLTPVHRNSKNCFIERGGSEALWFYFIAEPMNQYWLRQNVILVSKRFPQMAFQVQLVIIPLDLCSTESLFFEWLALAHRTVSLRLSLFAQELNHQRKANSPERLSTRDSSRYLESRGSPISEDISFLEAAHDDGNEEKDDEKESLDNTLAKCQALCCIKSQPENHTSIDRGQCLESLYGERQEFGEKLSASKKISESSSSLNTTNQCTQINPQDLIGHNCDPISQESFSEPEKASTNNDLSPRIIVYPEKSIQTVACSIQSRADDMGEKFDNIAAVTERVPDPWTHKINQVSRWLESSRTNGEDLRISGSYSKRLQEGHENLQISGGAEKTSRREKEKNCTGSHCRSDSCTAAFTVYKESASVLTGLQDVLDVLNDTVKEGSLLGVTAAAAKFDRRVIDKLEVRAVKTLFATNGITAPEVDSFVQKIAQNSSLTLDSLHIMKLEDFLDIAASHQLPIEAIERRISELLQVSDIISEERKELEDIARHGYKFDGIGSSSMEQDHDKGLEIPSETMSNSSKGLVQESNTNNQVFEVYKKIEHHDSIELKRSEAFKSISKEETDYADETRTEGYLWDADSCSGRTEMCAFSEAAFDGVTKNWKRAQRLSRIRRQRL